MLEKFKASLKSDLERKEVEEAYYQRKDNLAKLPEREEASEAAAGEEGEQVPFGAGDAIGSMHGDGVIHHTYEDIGKYTVFPKQMVKRMHPSKMFGRFYEEEYERSKTYGIQTREEGLRITNDLSRLTLPKERNINFREIASMENV